METNRQSEGRHEHEEEATSSSETVFNMKDLLVIAFPDARSNPYTMMIKLEHAVIAHVTMRRPDWSEDVTCLAELKSVKHWRIDTAHNPVINPRSLTDLSVFPRNSSFFHDPCSTRDNTGVSRPCFQ